MKKMLPLGLLFFSLLLGCGSKKEGDTCYNGFTSSCDGDTVVYCKMEGGKTPKPGKIVREPCAKKCVSSLLSSLCVEDTNTCDPKTFTPSCGKDAKGEFSILCESLGDKYYPVRKDLSCEDKGMTCMNPDNTHAICVQDKTECDPETFKARCLNEKQWVSCANPTSLDLYGSSVKGYPVTNSCEEGTTCSKFTENGVENEGCHKP